MGANPRVVSVLRDGYSLLFKQRPPSDKVPSDSERLCKPFKKPVFKGSIAQSNRQVGSGKSGCQVIPCLLQPAFPSSETQQKMETNLGSQSVESSVRNSLQSSGGPIGPLGSEVQWPLLKLDGPNFLKTN